jgi:hypothetical protein
MLLARQGQKKFKLVDQRFSLSEGPQLENLPIEKIYQ